ncbi:Myc-type [Macleaya cordata]|uniref:Myc-type n=1 Tax=Macleaya cordata TaxID=56857 RepID=A0A200QAW5_MACCD|nr:Myc-type [Macleaya cordata]
MKSRSGSSSSTTLDRKTIEKNRRMHMKALCFKLASLIPSHHTSSKDILTQLDQLEHAAIYIQELRGRIDELKRWKQLTDMRTAINSSTGTTATDDFSSISRTSTTNNNLGFPILEVRDFGSILEVILICGLNKNFMFNEVITVLEEEGAEVVNASFSIVGDKVFHTIHSQARCSRVGVETSRVRDRLNELIH